MSLLSAFSSREQCLREQIQISNRIRAFPHTYHADPSVFFRALEGQSLLISGGRPQDRAAVLLGAARTAPPGTPTVLIHNGNPALMPSAFTDQPGLQARVWTYDPLPGLSRGQQLALLTAGSQEELAIFWAFALDVCQALGLPERLASLASIQWTAIQWQQQVIRACPMDQAADLIARYDRDMAKLAAQADLHLARMQPGGAFLDLPQCSLEEGLALGRLLIIPMLGGPGSPMLAQCLEVLTAAMGRGVAFQLLLDNVPLPTRHPLVYSPAAQVQLVLAADDLCALAGDPADLTTRSCGAVLFRHAAPASAARLSLHFFGDYDRLVLEQNVGFSRSAARPLDRSAQQGLTTREVKDLRLPTHLIQTLPLGTACVRLPAQNAEGVFPFRPPDPQTQIDRVFHERRGG